MSTIREAIEALATALGMDGEYSDNWGVLHRTSLEGARRFLAAKGVLVDEELLGPTSEVLVASEDALPMSWSFWIDADTTATDSQSVTPDVAVRAIDEEGIEQAALHSPSNDLSVDSDIVPGRALVSVSVPAGLRPGVHRVRAHVRTRDREVDRESTWIICPQQAHVPDALEAGRRIAGVGIALYGVRSGTNWGIGDFSDLKKIVEWAHDDLGVDFVGLNPLHALFNRHPFNVSPYLPSSRTFRNFIYLDVEAIEDFHDSPAALSILNEAETQRSIRRLRNQKQVNCEEVADLKLRVLREAFRTFMANHGYAEKSDARWADFETYNRAEGQYLDRFAAFCAIEENFRKAEQPVYKWKEWPEAFRDPSSEAVERFCAHHREAVFFWKYLQWQIEKQLGDAQQYALDKGMVLGLYHDEALGVDRNGADFWSLREFYHEGFSVGAPPDAFAPNGQDWGFAPPNRDKIRAAGYEPVLRHLRANCKFGGALRLDHVMQLGRLFWIPAGTRPADGFYVEDYESDLVNLLTLESWRNKVLIIGEDLGTVPFAFRERLMANGIFSYRLFYFERDGSGNQVPFHAYPQHALVSISTHDLPTLAGFWSGRDIGERISVGQLRREGEQSYRQDREEQKAKILDRLADDGFLGREHVEGSRNAPFPTDELQSAVLGFLFRTPSRLVMINQEDIFLDVRQQNIPGTTWEHPNWVTKMLYTVEELRSDPVAVRLCRKFRRLVEESGRLTCGGER